uniref:Semaphorin-1A n=1 Tax=Haemonchus contortus TaxID=6289 RepID=A0A7I5E6J7_HAECO
MRLCTISLIYVLVRLQSCAILNLRPKQIVNSIGLGYRFGGHGSQSIEDSDHFKLLEADGDSLLVGARNAVYNLSLTTLSVHHKIDWKPPADVIEECLMKGKLKSDCQNYIRVLARQSSGKALICGTHAFSPKCREYVYSSTDGTLKNVRQFDGMGISPYDPRDNSTVVYLPETNEIYTGTVSDFVGNDPLIYRKRIGENDRDNGIRTQRDDARVLDSPNFVGSFVYKEHVYYWYRERAAEAMDNNEERQIYARVARVCRNDKGGARPANERWTSFVKARLNCSLPSATPFYFNELKAVSDPIATSANDHRVYAVFSTPDSDVRMSAVCSFSMKRIREEFDYGTFKQQRTVSSLWVPYNRNEIPRPRPGACVPDSTRLPEATVSFITRTPLMHRAIESINGPMLIEGSERADLTQIAVLPHVDSVNGQHYDIIYIGTSDGRVLKIIETVGNTTVIESITVFSKTVPVVNLLTTPRQLVVVSSDEVATIDVHHCNEPDSCNRCIALQDPHCAWDLTIARCVNRNSWSGGHFIQNIVFGQSEQCPEGIVISEELSDEPNSERVVESRRGMHSPESLFLACGLSALIALVIGSFVTYRVTRARVLAEAHHSASSTSGSDYDSFGRARLTRHDSLTTAAKIEHVYGAPPKSVDASSLVLTMPPAMTMSQHGSGINTPSRDKNAIMTSINQNTLPRDYKVKKVYL